MSKGDQIFQIINKLNHHSSGTKMYGVVLWSDCKDRKAVIWCEDHGDLAFYFDHDSSAIDGPVLDAGDLVQFHVSESAQMRVASNPRLVAEKQFPTLAQRLKSGVPAAGRGEVLRFPSGRAALAS